MSDTRQVARPGVWPPPADRQTAAQEAILERVFFILERRTQTPRAGSPGSESPVPPWITIEECRTSPRVDMPPSPKRD